MILELIASRAAELMNIFPAKGGISSRFSPQQIIERVNNDMVAEMGECVHASSYSSPAAFCRSNFDRQYVLASANNAIPTRSSFSQELFCRCFT